MVLVAASKGNKHACSRIDNMRTLAELCRAGEPLPGTLASWLASSLQSFLDQRSPSLNDAFGVRNARVEYPGGWKQASVCATLL